MKRVLGSVVLLSLLATLAACGHMSDLKVERDADRQISAAIARNDFATASRVALTAARTYTHPGDVAVQARLLGVAALWLAWEGREREAMAALDQCIERTTLYHAPIDRAGCVTQRREIRTRTGSYAQAPGLRDASQATATRPTVPAPQASTPPPAVRPPPGTTDARASSGGAMTFRTAVAGIGPIPGSTVKLYNGDNRTPAGHSIFGTERGLACLQRAGIQDDRAGEKFELICPVSVIGCYLTAPAFAGPASSDRCSIANSFTASTARSEGHIGPPVILSLPLNARVSVFVSAWNQCNWNMGLVLPMPDGWAAGCDQSIAVLQAEVKNDSPSKLRQLHKQRWGAR